MMGDKETREHNVPTAIQTKIVVARCAVQAWRDPTAKLQQKSCKPERLIDTWIHQKPALPWSRNNKIGAHAIRIIKKTNQIFENRFPGFFSHPKRV